MNTQTNYISYSNLLHQFIEPILDGTEDVEAYLEKAEAGKIAWNFCVSDKAGLTIDSQMKKIIKEITQEFSEAKETLNKLVLRKQMLFSQYDQFIFHVEIREKANGEKTLYVESVPTEILTNEK